MADFLFAPTPNLAASQFIGSKPAVSRAVFSRLLPELKARAFCISGIQCADVLQKSRDLIAKLPEGGDWEEIKGGLVAQISPYMVDDTAPAEDQASQRAAAARRAELLLRVHGQQGYAAAQYGMLDEQREVFSSWQYLTLGDSHVRPTHAALDGVVLPADSEFFKTHFPPWDWGCRCQIIPLSRYDTEKMKQADKDKPKDLQRVLDEPAQKELTKSRRLVRNGVAYNLTTQREEGKPGAYSFYPGDVRLTPEMLKGRYDKDIWDQFEEWAKKQILPDLIGQGGKPMSVFDWMNGLARDDTPPPASPPPIA